MNTMISETTSSSVERRRRQARARRLAKRVESLASAGRYDEAIICQSEVAELRPDDADAFHRLGLLYREVHSIEPALHALRHASHMDPSHRDLREALVETLLEAGRYEETVVESKALVKVAPRSLFARDVMSIAYLQLGQVERALQMTGEMITLDPLNPGHHFKRAMLFQQQGTYRTAVIEYTRAMEMSDPESDLYSEAEEALEALDEYQMHQILLLASEDKLFGLKLRRDSTEAIAERGFALSRDGLYRLRQLTQDHLSDFAAQFFPSETGGFRFYN